MRLRKPRILPLALSLILLCCALPAAADESPEFAPLDLQLYDPAALLGVGDVEKDKNGMIEVYYNYCLQSNTSPNFESYMETQCACTASEMMATMSPQQVRTMFEKSRNGDFEYARMLLLAYVPCMAQTTRQNVYDTCLQTNGENFEQGKQLKLCSCTADSMHDFVMNSGQGLIPGFERDSFRKSQSVANPLGYMMMHERYQDKYNHELYVCGLDLYE